MTGTEAAGGSPLLVPKGLRLRGQGKGTAEHEGEGRGYKIDSFLVWRLKKKFPAAAPAVRSVHPHTGKA